MTDSVIIRDVRPEDVEAVVHLAIAAWEPIYAYRRRTMGEDLFAAAMPDWQERKAREVRAECEGRGTARVCVAEDGGQVVGFVTSYADEVSRIGLLGNNAVHPDFQGRGIGSKMYRHVFERLKERGMRFVRTGTGLDPGHASARSAYRKAGFDIELPVVQFYRKL
jgi:ribosomal protein S18 acetylase RimI-like enzyme